ncbi:MAG TPA: TlyA family RNA methyltransferase [Syntrophorhabdaceae bacterium]|nr:TlyA family RNA methyltransferase [Syntrophorhabdaceae bacterium]
MVKERIDVLLTQKGLAPSREKAQALIMAGAVYVRNEQVLKSDKKIDDSEIIEIRGNAIPYVSYGGVKLKRVLDTTALPVTGHDALDIGSSTGGFIDCLLQSGVRSVYAVDTGTHQLHENLQNDPRVYLRENCNARYLTYEEIAKKFQIITIDVSFISLKKILPAAIQFAAPDCHIISLVKPQFEVGRFQVGKGGIVRDTGKIEQVLADIKHFGESLGLKVLDTIEAPREKEKKNREFFIVWGLQELHHK